MIEEVLREIRDYFIRDVHRGRFRITGGTLQAVPLLPGQYFKISGSVLNDGVYRHPAGGLLDEEFNGEVWALAVPKEVAAIADEVERWQAKYGGAESLALSPFQSESFGGYYYSKRGAGTSTRSGSSTADGWRSVFASRLNPWRKVRYESPIRGNGAV